MSTKWSDKKEVMHQIANAIRKECPDLLVFERNFTGQQKYTYVGVWHPDEYKKMKDPDWKYSSDDIIDFDERETFSVLSEFSITADRFDQYMLFQDNHGGRVHVEVVDWPAKLKEFISYSKVSHSEFSDEPGVVALDHRRMVEVGAPVEYYDDDDY